MPVDWKTPSQEFSAQCWGGPLHGDLRSAEVRRWMYYSIELTFVNGPDSEPVKVFVRGHYVLTVHGEMEGEIWNWEGPGADGDTIERLRLR